MGRVLFIPLAVAIMVLLFAAPALAGTVTIHGTVTDADGNPVKGADVTLFDSDKTELTSVQSDAGGNFVFTNVYVDTDYCSVRVLYNDLRQTYTNAAYLSDQYPAKGDQSLPLKGTRLYTLHLDAPSGGAPAASRPPLDPVGLTGVGTALALMLAAAMYVYLRKNA